MKEQEDKLEEQQETDERKGTESAEGDAQRLAPTLPPTKLSLVAGLNRKQRRTYLAMLERETRRERKKLKAR